MTDLKVGFITPEDKVYWMTYDEVNDFCKSLCYQEENYNKFQEFSKNYTYFSPYFDFIMFELEYVFINSLLEQNTFLKKVNQSLYQVQVDNEEEISYEMITYLAVRKKNGRNYSHMVACSDSELNIQKADISKFHNCMLDPNCYSMISTRDEKRGNHEITSNTILNQLLIYSPLLWKDYNKIPIKYSTIFLTEYCGFLHIDSVEQDKKIIGTERLLTKEVNEFKNLCIEKLGYFFFDWEQENKILLEKAKEYKIK